MALESVERRANTLVLGERGSGRTSFLWQVARHLGDRDIPYIFVTGSLAKDANDVLELIHYRIARTRPPRFGRTWEYERAPASIRSLEWVRDLEQLLLRKTAPRVVLVDELTSSEVAHTLFGRLRDELWQLPLTWVVAGDSRDRMTFLRPPADAFFSSEITLKPLSTPESVELLRRRIPKRTLKENDVRNIVETAKGNPRRLLLLASQAVVHGQAPDEIRQEEESRAFLLESLGDSARRVVLEIESSGSVSASDDEFLRRTGLTRSRAAQILRQLELLGVVSGSSEPAQGRRPRKLYALVK